VQTKEKTDLRVGARRYPHWRTEKQCKVTDTIPSRLGNMGLLDDHSQGTTKLLVLLWLVRCWDVLCPITIDELRQSLCKSYGADGWSEIVWSDAGISTHIPYFKRAAHAGIVVLVFWLALREAFQTILFHIESRFPVERVYLAMDSKRLCPSLTS